MTCCKLKLFHKLLFDDLTNVSNSITFETKHCLFNLCILEDQIAVWESWCDLKRKIFSWKSDNLTDHTKQLTVYAPFILSLDSFGIRDPSLGSCLYNLSL